VSVSDIGADPHVAEMDLGLVFDVKPLLSADGGFITMRLEPLQQALARPEQEIVSVPVASIGPDTGGFPLPAKEEDHASPAGRKTFSYPIQTVEITVRKARFDITLPDGGTALVWGLDSGSQPKAGARRVMVVTAYSAYFRRGSPAEMRRE
jgi:hypothetical protein